MENGRPGAPVGLVCFAVRLSAVGRVRVVVAVVEP